MNIKKDVLKKANEITRNYSKWLEPREIVNLWEELTEIGISVELLTNRMETANGYRVKANFQYMGNDVDNSILIYEVYEGNKTLKNEYNIYFS